MKTVPIAGLRASLSRYLAAVKAGEEVLVTERGRPIARISRISSIAEDEEESSRRLETRGLLRVGSKRFPRGFWSVPLPIPRVKFAKLSWKNGRKAGDLLG